MKLYHEGDVKSLKNLIVLHPNTRKVCQGLLNRIKNFLFIVHIEKSRGTTEEFITLKQVPQFFSRYLKRKEYKFGGKSIHIVPVIPLKTRIYMKERIPEEAKVPEELEPISLEQYHNKPVMGGILDKANAEPITNVDVNDPEYEDVFIIHNIDEIIHHMAHKYIYTAEWCKSHPKEIVSIFLDY